MTGMLLILFTICLPLWYKEPRVFLFLFYKMAYKYRSGKAIHLDKSALFPESKLLEENWQTIFKEYTTFINQAKSLPKFHQVDKANKKISFENGPAWRTIVLKAYDVWFEKNSAFFPQTVHLLRPMKQVSTVMFSILEPHVQIPEHTGKLGGIYRYHLGLSIPASSECYIVVDKHKYVWKEGEGILFDDTYLHSVMNNTEESRIVLFLDIKKPGTFLHRFIGDLFMKLIRYSPMLRRAKKTGTISMDT